jgi:hypothetical protein
MVITNRILLIVGTTYAPAEPKQQTHEIRTPNPPNNKPTKQQTHQTTNPPNNKSAE